MITLFTGLFFTLAIFPGIGPQNLNTLSHGIKRNHHYLVGTTCVIADGVLIVIGCTGLKLTKSYIVILIINTVGILLLVIIFYLKLKLYLKPTPSIKLIPH